MLFGKGKQFEFLIKMNKGGMNSETYKIEIKKQMAFISSGGHWSVPLSTCKVKIKMLSKV